MNGDPNHLEEAVRESLASLSDFELIWRSRSPDYTEFARQAAREELARRHQAPATQPVYFQDNSKPRLVVDDSPSEGSGCFVDLWRGKDYQGRHVHVSGPREYSELQSFPTEWGKHVSSLRVGPCAFVEAYEEQGLNGKMVCFGPNEEVPDLAEIGFENNLGSMKIISLTEIFDGLESAREPDVPVQEEPVQQNVKPRKKRKGGDRGY